jgi:ATP-dependent helicase HrpA
MMQDEQHLYDFYARHIPDGIYNQPLFEKWWRQQKTKTPNLLNADIELLMSGQVASFDESLWPDQIAIKGLTIPLDYHFSPGESDDGVTATIPLVMLNQLQASDFDWLVPGLLQEKLTQLIKTLPKSLRRNFVPAPDYARACVGCMSPANGDLLTQFGRQLTRMTGVDVPDSAWQVDKVPVHLQMNFHIIDRDAKTIAQGRDLNILQRQWQDKAKSLFAAQTNELPGEDIAAQDNVEAWNFGDLPECREIESNGMTLRSYPALVVKEGVISLRSMDQLEQAETETRHGLVYLFQAVYRKEVEYAQKNIPGIKQACLYYASLGQCEELKNHIVYLSVLRALKIEDDLIRSQDEFTTRGEQARKNLMSVLNEVAAMILEMLTLYHQLNRRLGANLSPAWLKSVADIRSQLEGLFHQDYLRSTPYENLKHYPRYLKAIQLRMDKLNDNLARDARLMNELNVFWRPFQEYIKSNAMYDMQNQELQKFRWMLEEYRVSLFAQELKTMIPVSAKRLRAQWKLV